MFPILPTTSRKFLPQHQAHQNQNQNPASSASSNSSTPKSNAADGAATGPPNNMFAKYAEPTATRLSPTTKDQHDHHDYGNHVRREPCLLPHTMQTL